MRRTIAVIVAAGVLLASRAAADPLPTIPTELTQRATVTAESGATLDLPAGWLLVPPDAWARMDAELERLQEAETRLAAENKSLRKSVTERSSPWYWIAGALATGFAAGMAYEAIR